MNSPLSYIGGKSKLANTIIGMAPEHKSYCEVFSGAAWVFFKKEPSRYEFINDLDGNLICFYRVLQNHLEEFLKQFKFLLCSRQLFKEFKDQQQAGGLTDIQRAARYYYLQRMCFSGRVKGRTYGAGVTHKPRINLLRMEENLSEIHLRLAQVTIENLTYQKFIATYDREETFFYCDPPYYKAPYYKHNFNLEDFEQLAATLKDIKGKFILSINDHDTMRKVFKDFKIEQISTKYSVSNKIGKQVSANELIIKNF
ncbi:MAG: DNA adenine methylase [Desulfobacteraceae bacterium]|nr:DNA adenine methylase [Desulfobacteraceae bacterium]